MKNCFVIFFKKLYVYIYNLIPTLLVKIFLFIKKFFYTKINQENFLEKLHALSNNCALLKQQIKEPILLLIK